MPGMPMVKKGGKMVPEFAADGVGKMRKGGMAKLKKDEMPSKMGKVKTSKPKMGSASKRADGVAKKGKTKGTEVMMAYGGMPKKMRAGGSSCK